MQLHILKSFLSASLSGSAASLILRTIRRPQIRSIIAKRQKAIQKITLRIQHGIEKELELAKEEVAAVLGPERLSRGISALNT